MNYKTPVAVWLYMILTTVGEVYVFYTGPGTFSVDIAVGVIAMINSLVAALFLMNIRKEPPVIQYLMLAPLALIMVLILTMLFAFAQ
ncbi:MAG TPA: cytochrome C oxidase subunit IV family protein [Nitrososphaerales archaeon]|nr:cytochrome C oxidase subunit IV family protein [Nitrososphaerales archaeon]